MAKDADKSEDDSKSKGGMMKIVIVALAMLGVGAGGAYGAFAAGVIGGDSEDGFVYTWTDPDVQNGQDYYYWIDTLYLSGVEGRVGPLAASPRAIVQPVTFTGDVDADFFSLGEYFPDPGGSGSNGDVQTGLDSLSGNDFAGIAMAYEGNLDILYVGIDMHGICGDADGDGDPDRTGAALAAAGGTDAPRFSLDETFTFVLDTDNDGEPDIVAGTPIGRGLAQFRLAEWRQGFDLTTSSLIVDPIMCVWPHQAPDRIEDLTLRFEGGRCVSMNGESVTPLQAMERANTIAGRICNYMDLRGGGYTVDGACSSSLLSVATAANAL